MPEFGGGPKRKLPLYRAVPPLLAGSGGGGMDEDQTGPSPVPARGGDGLPGSTSEYVGCAGNRRASCMSRALHN